MLNATLRTLGLVVLALSAAAAAGVESRAQEARTQGAEQAGATEAAQAIVDGTCLRCHNDRLRSGNMSLEGFEVAAAVDRPELAEHMVRKLRAGLMPPAGVRRPDEAALTGLAVALETRLDAAAAANPDPGRRGFQRLNRAEYERSIRDLLAVDIHAGDYLPLDTKSANFDNIADVQMLSPTLMNGYLRAASDISRLAVGDPEAGPVEAAYKVPRWVSQREQVEGAPYGSRGGISVTHTFPADGDYRFRVSFHHETTGDLFGSGRGTLHTTERPEQIEIAIDGERAAAFAIDRWMHVSDPLGVNIWTDPIHVTAGPHRVSAVFVPQFDGPVQDLISPHDWSLASTSVANAYGFTSLPHLRDLAIRGPQSVTGVSETPSRARIFTCRPAAPAQARPGGRVGSSAGAERPARGCAGEIIDRLGAAAYRRPLTPENRAALMALYDAGQAGGGFEAGVRMAIEGMLASPHFVFRFEEPPVDVAPTDSFAITDHDLASRLSYFLWASVPDAELRRVAEEQRLFEPEVLEAQVRRMLADPRSDALATRFAAQWLRLPDLEPLQPDVRVYPDFDEQLKWAMQRETELFFRHLVREDRNLLELFAADYTFLNERLAEHYGDPGRHRSPLPPRDVPCRRAAAGSAGSRQHSRVDVLRRPHVARPARQVGDGGAARQSAAAAAAQRAGSGGHGGGRGRTASLGARAAGAAPVEPGVQLVPPHDGPDRPGPGVLRRHRGPAHLGQRLADRCGGRALRRQPGPERRRSARRAAAASHSDRSDVHREPDGLCSRPAPRALRHAGRAGGRPRRGGRRQPPVRLHPRHRAHAGLPDEGWDARGAAGRRRRSSVARRTRVKENTP